MSHFVSTQSNFDDLNAQLEQRNTTSGQDEDQEEQRTSPSTTHNSPTSYDLEGQNDGRFISSSSQKSDKHLSRTNSFTPVASRPQHRKIRGQHHHHHPHHRNHHANGQEGQDATGQGNSGPHMHVLSLDAQAHLRNNGVIGSRSIPRKLGTWDGVFMPVSLNILGIILFLRFGILFEGLRRSPDMLTPASRPVTAGKRTPKTVCQFSFKGPVLLPAAPEVK